jgi:hypothetical protein
MVSLNPTQSAVQTVLRSFLLQILPAGIECIQGQDNRVPEPTGSDFVVMTAMRRTRLETNIDTLVDVAFTASIAGNLMTVTGVQYGTIEAGNQLFGSGLASGSTTVVQQISGSIGGTGTYSVSQPQTVPSQLLAAGTMNIMQPTEIVYQLDVHGPNSPDNAQTITTLFRDEYATDFFEAAGIGVDPLYADDPHQVPYLNENSQVETRWVVEAHLQANQIVQVPAQAAATLSVVLVDVDAAYPPE